MDRKNGTKMRPPTVAAAAAAAGASTTTTARRKLPVKTNVPSMFQPPATSGLNETEMSKSIGTLKAEYTMQSTFASVHRPRQIGTAAAIRRTGSQLKADRIHHQQQQQQQKYAGTVHCRPDSASFSVLGTGKIDSMNENNAGIFNQPAAVVLPLPVQIPDPYANSTPLYGRHHQQQHQQQQQQLVRKVQVQTQYHQQQQNLDMALSQKADYLQQNISKQGTNQRCPTAGTNQSKASAVLASRSPKQQSQLQFCKMSPKLLNEIYEKHLLSQTVFDGFETAANNQFPALAGTSREIRRLVITKPSSGSMGGHQQQQNHSNKSSRGDDCDNLYESIHSNYHIYEKIDPAGKRGSRVEQYVRPSPPLQPRPKSLPVDTSLFANPNKLQASAIQNVPANYKRNTSIVSSYRLSSSDVLRTAKSPAASGLSGGCGAAGGGGGGLSPIAEKPTGGIGGSAIPVYGGIGANGGAAAHKLLITADKINIALETAKALATAAYIERAAQRLASGSVIQHHHHHQQQQQQQQHQPSQHPSTNMSGSVNMGGVGAVAEVSGFCGAIHRTPPPVPAGLSRRMANREVVGLGKVKVMLRVSDDPPKASAPTISAQEEAQTASAPQSVPSCSSGSYLTVDKKKRQVTLCETQTNLAACSSAATPERGPMVSAPKMFAFDALFTTEDSQHDVCGSALSEVIPAVLEGSDGCLLSLGYPGAGQSRTMFGTLASAPSDLGAIPCAIAWLFKGINEKRQKSGARFSVRVSALGVNATKPGSSSRDLLAGHATESDDSPGMYLRDDFLGRPTELRAPTAERAALFLDLALSGRAQGSSNLEPALIYTLHVYQYSLSGKRGVEGGRSRLHLIDLGGCANRSGGLPLSGIGNVLLAILSGQKHPPNRDHPLTPLLRDCLAPLTCHVAIVAHVVHSQTHTDTLTTIQLASRIHRMRRRKPRHHLFADRGAGLNGSSGHQSGGSSEGPDPSSSDFSQDTVIYMGPCDDPTDGEHPPVYLPSLNSGDNRCAMNKALKGSVAEKPTPTVTASPQKKKITSTSKRKSETLPHPIRLNYFNAYSCPLAAQNPAPAPIPIRTDSLKRNQTYGQQASAGPELVANVIQIASQHVSPKVVAGAFKHMTSVSKSSNIPTPKGSPLRRSNPPVAGPTPTRESPSRQVSEEKWIDGPRMSKSKVHEARHLLREINHVKNHETWVDGPKTASASQVFPPAMGSHAAQAYGFMDNHKKSMIRQWVENQSMQLLQQSMSANNSPAHSRHQSYNLPRFRPSKSDEDGFILELDTKQEELVNPIAFRGFTATSGVLNSSESHVRTGLKQAYSLDNPEIQPMCPVYSTAAVNTTSMSTAAAVITSTTAPPSVNDNHSERSHPASSHASDKPASKHGDSQEEEDQDSGPSEVPPALPLMDPLGSREISHESIHRLCSRHVSRDNMSVHSHNSHNAGMMDCGLQVTEDEIARTMGGEHPLSALSHGELSVVSSFNVGGDVFSDCVIGDNMRNQFDQLARLREIFTSQLAMAEVTPAFRLGDAGSVYSEPAYRFNTGPASVCSEPAYRPPSPRCRDCRQSLNLSRTPSQSSLPSLTGIVAIAGMEQYASLRHPDGASDPNLPKLEKNTETALDPEEHIRENPLAELDDHEALKGSSSMLAQQSLPTLPLLPLSTPEAYDSGHDSTPRTSKHSGISRRAESGYHSVGTVRDSDESSFGSAASRANQKSKKRNRTDKSLCHWLRNPFNCTYPDTEGDVSDF
ncbi:kinesin-like protein GA13060 [Sabethes cyaneus]|uniref:kinesin-like protein GA13060 n=1 Tax=Sabethes cyaneus TaxID=53552 RepID=UPI00237DF4AC|nr:kinesin-like protein GA13060 [Sabethes cyaneus]